MDSKRSQEHDVQSKWADLPVELLGLISGRLQNNGEVIGFRSVCRSWRSSTPPPPNKLSPSLPLKLPFFDGQSFSNRGPGHLINVCALYLVRPRSDPSKAWIVSVQEAEPGKLVLRHALTYQEINSDGVLGLDENRIVATQSPIAGFYAHNMPCEECKGVNFTRKVLFVSGASSSSSSSSSGCRELVGLCSSPRLLSSNPFVFRLELDSGAFEARRFSDEYVESRLARLMFQDFVRFNGRIFVVDWDGHVYVLDHTNLRLVRMTQSPVRVPYVEDRVARTRVEFVVSDGDLYVAWFSIRIPSPSACEIYRLVVETDERDECSAISVERVRDLGDRVFFFTYQCSFSISARVLPRPWRDGNCVLIVEFGGFNCGCCFTEAQGVIPFRVSVFELGTQTFTKLWAQEGHPYSDLFSPPVSFKIH